MGAPAPFLNEAVNQQLLALMMALQAAGDEAEVERVWLSYATRNSWPMTPSYFGDDALRLTGLFGRLLDMGVHVRCTRADLLWVGGQHPQSQLGKYVAIKRGGVIFLDVVGPNLRRFELLDTLAHEAVHATGPALRRWRYDCQPHPAASSRLLSKEYIIEECVAIYGAQMILWHLGISHCPAPKLIEYSLHRLASPKQLENMASEVTQIAGLAQDAVGYLLGRPSAWSRLQLFLSRVSDRLIG